MRSHPFTGRWNHNAHRYPAIARTLVGATTVLDVGCGDGTLARFLAAPGRRVLGLDADPRSPALWTAAARDLPDLPPGAEVRLALGSAEALPLPDASVDAVTLVMVLHHTDPARTLAEVRRVLRPGGVAHLLGYGRSAGPWDALAELRDVLAHRWYRRRTVAWDAGVAVAGPTLTWAENRRLLRRELPGGRYRRLALWRYRYVWRAPDAQLARRVR